MHNRLSLDVNRKCPLEIFLGIEDDIGVEDSHTFGYLVFHLDSSNHSGGFGTPKWEPHSHTGIYKGLLSCHDGLVALTLNLVTGLVSPRYHVVFDTKFATIHYL